MQFHDEPTQANKITPMQSLANHLPGAFFRYRLDANGKDRIDQMGGGCKALWDVSNHAIESDIDAFWAVVDPRDLPYFRESITQSARTLKDLAFEWRIDTPNGKARWMHSRGRPISAAQGAVLWHVFTIDVTESRRVDNHLRDNNERFRQMLDGISNVSVQGYGMDLTTRYWNKASERLYGFTAKEAIGRNLLDLIIPEHMHDGVLAEVTRMIRTGKAIPEGNLTLQRKDGSPIDVFSSHAFVEMPGYEPELYCIDLELARRRDAENPHTQPDDKAEQEPAMEALANLHPDVRHDYRRVVAAMSSPTLCTDGADR